MADQESEATKLSAAAEVDRRMVDVWREWLGALATDAEAAQAAAMAYQELDEAARDRWVAALEHDAAKLDVPRIAVYAPLLAVEANPERRARIEAAIGPVDESAMPRSTTEAFSGTNEGGIKIAALVMPLYLDFVQVLACGYRNDLGFVWVRHDPIVCFAEAPKSGDTLDGVRMEATPLKPLIDELAETVLSHIRQGRAIPEALRVFADLFSPGPESGVPSSDP